MLACSPIMTADPPESCITQLCGQGRGLDYGGVNLWPIELKVTANCTVSKVRECDLQELIFNTDGFEKEEKDPESLIFVAHAAMMMIAAVVI